MNVLFEFIENGKTQSTVVEGARDLTSATVDFKTVHPTAVIIRYGAA